MPLEDDFCDIAKKARQGRGVTAEELAERCGVSASDLAELERGRRPPNEHEVETLARALGLRPRPLADIALKGWQPHPLSTVSGVDPVLGDIGGYAVKGYVLYDGGTRDAIFIDTAYNARSMLEVVQRRDLRLTGVCLTHGHIDHAGGLDRILDRWNVPVYMGKDDLSLLQWRPPSVSLRPITSHEDGKKISVGGLTVQCLVTPGHTPGGICYRVHVDSQDICFVGDTLFAGSIGRANPFSLYPLHLESVRRRLLTLPSRTMLFPGHGPATTVAEELEHNPFADES
jgi:glyoxylase-like metal-dependent hydrolase (beta-lactamase superfamily II)